ncbi:MAG: hypothetical protein J0I12_28605 [Candidatus Eremiobacteraeota bacterium]|nr:hypothetical protein [Candidatus Eremiobacteraeota bacterium]
MRYWLWFLLLGCGCSHLGPRSQPKAPPTQVSTGLQLVENLQTPLASGQSLAWSVALSMVWRKAESELFKGPILLGDDSALRGKICSVEATDLPGNWVTTGAQRGPGGAELTCSLAAKMPFAVPYFQNDQPLNYRDSRGQIRQVASFGIRARDEYAYWALREQAEILFRTEGKDDGPIPPLDEFGLDLCRTSRPWRLLVAVIHRPASLQDGIARVQKLTRECPHQPDYQFRIGSNDQLLVPEQNFECSVQTSHKLQNPGWPPQLNIKQRLYWELNRGGAELNTEAKMMVSPVPSLYYFDKPYLIYVETRLKHQPIFAMWVDGAGSLQPYAASSK